MKKLLLFILLFLTFQVHFSQESYTINDETLILKTEVEGDLDFLWTSKGGIYRFFVKSKNGTITELKNTKDQNKNYLEEYKQTLISITNGASTEDLKFRFYDLKVFVDAFNQSLDSSYNSVARFPKAGVRFAFFGGQTNNPFIENPENIKTLLVGGELEFFEGSKATPRHSGFIQGRHSFETDEFSYSSTEIALGYRFRVISTNSFSFFVQSKLATINFTNSSFTNTDGIQEKKSQNSFDTPFIFGVGSDIKIGKNSYITLIYSEIFAAFLDNQGNFSTDFAIGYKFNL